MAPRDPAACAAFLLIAFVFAGAAQTLWLAMRISHTLAFPLDGGASWRGRRVFGANKTARGFVVMVPAAAAAFALLAALSDPDALGLWPMSIAQYAGLGAVAGLGFMAGELPNSFVKRRLAIAPGAAAVGPVCRAIQFVADRLDSGVGMLAAVSVVVPTPAETWGVVLLLGSVIHWSFSLLLFRLGVKPRPA